MAMGMDMLIKTAIKSLGIDPEVLLAQLAQWLKWGESRINDFDARLRDMEATQSELVKQNAQYIAYIKACNPALNTPPQLNNELKEVTQNG